MGKKFGLDKIIKNLCLSTVEMCWGLEEANTRGGTIKPGVLSMDVVKMFPSLVAAVVARLVREEYMRADLEVDDNELWW